MSEKWSPEEGRKVIVEQVERQRAESRAIHHERGGDRSYESLVAFRAI